MDNKYITINGVKYERIDDNTIYDTVVFIDGLRYRDINKTNKTKAEFKAKQSAIKNIHTKLWDDEYKDHEGVINPSKHAMYSATTTYKGLKLAAGGDTIFEAVDILGKHIMNSK